LEDVSFIMLATYSYLTKLNIESKGWFLYCTDILAFMEIGTYINTDIQTYAQTDRKTDRQKYLHTYIQTDR